MGGDSPFFPSGLPGIPPIPGIPPFSPIPDIPPIDAPPPLAVTKQIKDPKAKPFFLPPNNASNLLEFRGAVRDTLTIKPIIDGKQIFTELEKAIDKAESSVLIAFWLFNLDMPLVTDSSRTWLDLLVDVVSRKVKVRLFMNDFDPVLGWADFHTNAWERYFRLLDTFKSVSSDLFQVVCSRHETEIADSIMDLAIKNLYDNHADEINKADESYRKNKYSNSPGLWDKLDYDATTTKLSPKVKGKSYPAWPGSHHQKIVIVDGKYAYTGGLNVAPVYLDSQKHNKPIEQLPWHDAFVKVEGSFPVRDFIRNFISIWNKERVNSENFLKNAYKASNVKLPVVIGTTTDLTEKIIPAQLTSTATPKIPGQVHRTISKKGTDPKGIAVTIRQDILEGTIQAISNAQEYIYIENQYFREKTIGDAIIKRQKDVPDLKTIIVVPSIIEEFLDPSKVDDISNYGAALQYEIFDEMISKLGKNLGLYCMIRHDDKLIYVHSKLMIIDDAFVSLGSANSNPRSYKMDTELNYAWYDTKTAEKLRLDLWEEILGNPSGMNKWQATDYITKWNAIANKNKSARPKSRKGFVMPFDNVVKGKKNLFADLSPFT
ncbi:MAG TPA: phospholipase D-like domain-containing protein [Bacteroidia bacterium]|nr:phospholipase D-like domain-containing protein [Bacteroidia bacterium]